MALRVTESAVVSDVEVDPLEASGRYGSVLQGWTRVLSQQDRERSGSSNNRYAGAYGEENRHLNNNMPFRAVATSVGGRGSSQPKEEVMSPQVKPAGGRGALDVDDDLTTSFLSSGASSSASSTEEEAMGEEHSDEEDDEDAFFESVFGVSKQDPSKRSDGWQGSQDDFYSSRRGERRTNRQEKDPTAGGTETPSDRTLLAGGVIPALELAQTVITRLRDERDVALSELSRQKNEQSQGEKSSQSNFKSHRSAPLARKYAPKSNVEQQRPHTKSQRVHTRDTERSFAMAQNEPSSQLHKVSGHPEIAHRDSVGRSVTWAATAEEDRGPVQSTTTSNASSKWRHGTGPCCQQCREKSRSATRQAKAYAVQLMDLQDELIRTHAALLHATKSQIDGLAFSAPARTMRNDHFHQHAGDDRAGEAESDRDQHSPAASSLDAACSRQMSMSASPVASGTEQAIMSHLAVSDLEGGNPSGADTAVSTEVENFLAHSFVRTHESGAQRLNELIQQRHELKMQLLGTDSSFE